jgi:pimeloyl-ACP methyl ester carboxylesterase
MQRFLEQFPNADSVLITDAGHACAIQQPERFAHVVERLMAVTT